MAVTMEPRDRWTDARLDDLNMKVDTGFARVDADMREVRGEIRGLRTETNARFDSLNRSVWGGTIAVIAAVVGSNIFF